ncbi:hypothetical protein [Tomitella gaofuii]|uniref:hypothetical protein n=1 Tax=Tomitella gaofuii TaxID=2760083 RepID=UPI0015FA1BB2|nr:hypothetical protein [Tomitella gaofuii]
MQEMPAEAAVVGGIGLAAVGIGASVASTHPVDGHGAGQQQWNGHDGDCDQRQDGAQPQWEWFWGKLPQGGQPNAAPQLPLPQVPRTTSLEFGSMGDSL